MWADLVVFDPETVLDGNDFTPAEATMRYPIGVDHLVVNGVVTMKDGEHTGAKAGKVFFYFIFQKNQSLLSLTL
jgi:N-acyl-D-amino-acid deacylase